LLQEERDHRPGLKKKSTPPMSSSQKKKRNWREPFHRPWLIWFFQGKGSALLTRTPFEEEGRGAKKRRGKKMVKHWKANGGDLGHYQKKAAGRPGVRS